MEDTPADHNKVTFLQADFDVSSDCKGKVFRSCYFPNIELEGASFQAATFKGESDDSGRNLISNCKFIGTLFNDAKFNGTQFSTTEFKTCDLENVEFSNCKFVGCDFSDCNIENVSFQFCDFVNCKFSECEGVAKFESVKLDRKTNVLGLKLNQLESDMASYSRWTRNQRLNRWTRWYQRHPIGQWPVWIFWSISNYGTSTRTLLFWFVIISVLFQQIYIYPYYFGQEPILKNLTTVRVVEEWDKSTDAEEDRDPPPDGDENRNEENAKPRIKKLDWKVVQIRALFVSMCASTVGYGDILPREDSLVAHIVVIFHVVFSYLLLAALVARVTSAIQE